MATIEGTRSLSGKYSEMKYKELGNTGLAVSDAGFGCYRVDKNIPEHAAAIEHALKHGINLLDTSANYADGGSEELIGSVLEKMTKEKSLELDEVIIVSKGGYLQGTNLKNAKKREEEGKPYPDTVKCSPDLWHCIHPEFLEEQITLSLNKLKTERIDIYLLHNPEYFLSYSGITDVQKCREEYYDRIAKAFEFLEREVKKGRISYYGVSSNTFAEDGDKNNFTSLDKLIETAKSISTKNKFAVIELPLNLLERDAMKLKNSEGGTKPVLSAAMDAGLGVLVNRPLNAIEHNRIVRLTDFKIKENRTPEEVDEMISDLGKMEENLRSFVDEKINNEDERKTLIDCLSVAQILMDNMKKFESPNHFTEVKGYYLIPRANYAVSGLAKSVEEDPEMIKTLTDYALTLNILLDSVESILAKVYNFKNEALHNKLNLYLKKEQFSLSLSQKAVLLCNSLNEVSCTLVGMRKKEYVDDVLGAVKQDYVDDAPVFWNSGEELR